MDTRCINEKYAMIAQNLIETEPALAAIKNSAATITYLSSTHKKKADGKKVFAQCEKIPEKYKWSIPCDFTITVFEPNVEGLSGQKLEILLLHELLHVGIDIDDEGEEVYSIVPHDFEDFELIVKRFGAEWSRG